jgi:tetratricopeptide (TPR) repeat protein
MSRRNQKPGNKKSAAAPDPQAQRHTIERLIESGKVKEAHKEAKLYFHQDASPENRHLVERTSVLRMRSLLQGRMLSTAQEVATSLLEFGVKDPNLLREFVLLLPRVGLADRALALQEQSGAPELRDRLLLVLADRAVLHPDRAGDSLPEHRVAAGPVRLALAALDAGDTARALAALQPIPRNSPMADWRYFVRGLVAFRQRELEQAKANWERLHPDRAAKKIARALLPEVDAKAAATPPEALAALEPHVFGEPVLERLAEVRAALDRGDWARALQLIIPLRLTLVRIDRRFAQRLTEVVLLPLSAEIKNRPPREADRLIAEFKTALEPLPWDPNWHRLEALLWEGPRGEPDKAVQSWRNYLRDLEKGVTGLPGESRQVQALVWRRIGEISADLVNESEAPAPPFAPQRPEREVNALRDRATEALQQSLRLDPNRIETHQRLIENFESWDQPERLVAALEELLRVFPGDVDALKQLIRQRQLRDEPEFVLGYVERLRKLKPLDPDLDREEMWGQLVLARHRALSGRWDEGRAAFTRVETALPGSISPHLLLARRAAFEFKAGNDAQAEELVERARPLPNEPTVLWLSLAIESVRYELPPALRERFQREFQSALARKANSETAGALAVLIGGYFIGQIDYPGRDGHAQDVLRYLKRTTRLKYREPDLRQVCALLAHAGPEDDKLLAALVKRGLKLFPNSPFFIRMDAERGLMGGPMAFNSPRTREKLQRALALAQASQDPQDAALVPGLQALLARLQDLSETMRTLPLPFGLPGAGNLNDMFGALMDQFDPDFDFDDDEPDVPPRQPPRRKKR